MKKFLAMLLTVLMLSTMTTYADEADLLIAPSPGAAPQTVTVQVEGAAGNVYYGEVAWTEGATALSVVEAALTEIQMEYVIKDSPYGGKYISSVGDTVEAQFGGYDGWMYYVNSQSPMFSIDGCLLQGGDQVLVAFADMSALLPILTVTKDHEGAATVTVTADVTTYDESNNWAPVTTRQPVADVRLTVDGETYTTNEQGKAVLSAEASAKETVSVQVEKYTEAGAPVLVRLAPGSTLDLAAAETVLPFSDLENGQWYTPYVLDMVEQGAVTGFPDGTFQPQGNVTRGQVANMLYKLAGQPAPQGDAVFSDVKAGSWYDSAIRWAYAQGIVTGDGGKFRPDDNVTRQDLAVMLVRYQQAAGIELAQDGEAPAFADNDKIASYAAEAVYKLQKAGIVSGNEGKFDPTATATRGQLCKMLSGLVVSD